MPRLYGSAFEDEHPGTLTLKQESSDRVEVFYTPSQERVQLSGLGENDTEMCVDARRLCPPKCQGKMSSE